jgi:hypothetical protein
MGQTSTQNYRNYSEPPDGELSSEFPAGVARVRTERQNRTRRHPFCNLNNRVNQHPMRQPSILNSLPGASNAGEASGSGSHGGRRANAGRKKQYTEEEMKKYCHHW